MEDGNDKQEARPRKRGLVELLASWEPLPEEDAMPEIERPPAESFTDFDDWPDKEEEAKINDQPTEERE